LGTLNSIVTRAWALCAPQPKGREIVAIDERVQRLLNNLGQAIVGKEKPLKLALIALFSGGHALLEDVPGVGKTLLAKSLASSIDGTFQRVQFTPDLLPSDVTGTNIWNPKNGTFDFMAGPVFANVLLADEINRATPRTQASLLEVMEEHQVTIDGTTRKVQEPFFVIATQNPVEYQGTFPLPEAQLDRFALSFSLGYPTEAEELTMLQRLQSGTLGAPLQPCLSLEEVHAIRKGVAKVSVSDALQRYILALVRTTREDKQLTLGVSPRGAVALQKAAQALTYLEGRTYPEPDDIKWLAPAVLSHRLIPASGQSRVQIVKRLLDTVAVP